MRALSASYIGRRETAAGHLRSSISIVHPPAANQSLVIAARDAADDGNRGDVDIGPLGRPLVEDRIDRVTLSTSHGPNVPRRVQRDG
jgi:hypothetical protein